MPFTTRRDYSMSKRRLPPSQRPERQPDDEWLIDQMIREACSCPEMFGEIRERVEQTGLTDYIVFVFLPGCDQDMRRIFCDSGVEPREAELLINPDQFAMRVLPLEIFRANPEPPPTIKPLLEMTVPPDFMPVMIFGPHGEVGTLIRDEESIED
jgi:hypothetical protein